MSFANLTLPSFPSKEETFSFTSEQEEIFYTFSELYSSRSSNLVVDALAGTGKAQPLDELVLTPEGFVTMNEIQAGDLVISEQGESVQVMATYITENLEMFRVLFSDGSSVRCCKDHLWKINRVTKVKGKTAKVSEVVPLSYMIPLVTKYRTKAKNFSYPYSVSLCSPVAFSKKELKLAPYSMGYLLGNGHLSLAKTSSAISVHEDDKEEILSFLDSSFIRRQTQYTSKAVNLLLETKMDSVLAYYSLRGVTSLFKAIPKDYLLSSIEDRIELLRGLMDSDGCCKNNKARFSSSSITLIEDVRSLVNSLGGIATLSVNTRNINTEYTLQIRTPFNPFHLERKAKEYSILYRDMFNFKTIVDIIPIGRETGKCLGVDSESHLYLTKDYTVTHNTSTVLALAEKNPEVNFLMACFGRKNADDLTKRCYASGCFNLKAETLHKIAYDWFVSCTGKHPVKRLPVDWILENIAPRVEFRSYELKNTSWGILNLIRAFCQEEYFTLSEFLKAFPEWNKLGAAVLQGSEIFIQENIALTPDKNLPIDLNGVIKLFQLCNVQLCDDKDTVLIIEEYQDINGNQAGVLACQENFKIAIGDVNQNIYAWRGAGKFVEIVEQEEWFKLYLTTSFRVNPTDADFANTLLKLIDPANPVFKGASKKKEIKTSAFLSRTNASAIVKAVELLEAKKEFALTLDLKPLWEELWYLFNLNKGKTSGKKPPASLSWIKTKKDLSEAYENLSDIRRLVNLLNLLQGCPGGLYNMQKRLDQLAKDTEGKILPISIGTVHKAKGLEWDEVYLNEDILEALLPRYDEEAKEESFNKEEKLEELRLLYVAVTRAKVRTNLPEGLEDFIYSLL